MKKQTVIGIAIGVIVIASFAYIKLNHQPQVKNNTDSSSVSPFANKAEMVNTKGQHVDMFVRGAFRNKGTSQTFVFYGNASNDSQFASCIKSGNCKEVYFLNCTEDTSHSCEGSVDWGISTANGPVYSGTITHKQFYSSDRTRHQSNPSAVNTPTPDDRITYTISYQHNGMTSTITETQNLCEGNIPFNPGYDCNADIYNIGDKIIFNLSGGKIGEQYNANQGVTVGDLLNYQYYYVPDTGDVLPVTIVQQ